MFQPKTGVREMIYLFKNPPAAIRLPHADQIIALFRKSAARIVAEKLTHRPATTKRNLESDSRQHTEMDCGKTPSQPAGKNLSS
jgi:hypothetical protein